MSFRGTLTLLLACAIPSTVNAQSWYYTGTKSCMDFGNGISQCFTQGFINQMSDARPRSYGDVHRAFETGQQAGEGFGSLVGVLIGLWIQHHQAVKAETADLRAQLVAYHHAENELLDDQLKTVQEDEQLCKQLSSLDPARAEHWQQGADFSRDMQSTIERVRENMQQVEAMELKEKSPKALQMALDDPSHGVKKRQEIQRNWAFQLYLQHQFLVARVGMYSQQPSNSSPAATLSAATASTPVPQGATGTVTVEKTTENADVYVDGGFVGNTPAVLHLPSGNHTVRIAAGKQTWERTLAVSDGADLRLRPAF